jgi:hypothetical protein
MNYANRNKDFFPCMLLAFGQRSDNGDGDYLPVGKPEYRHRSTLFTMRHRYSIEIIGRKMSVEMLGAKDLLKAMQDIKSMDSRYKLLAKFYAADGGDDSLIACKLYAEGAGLDFIPCPIGLN